MYCHVSTSRGNALISTLTAVAILGVLGLALSFFNPASIRTRRLRHESERLSLFLREIVTRSSYSLEAILVSVSSNTLRAESDKVTAQTFTPRRGMTLDIPGASSQNPREMRQGRSCSPTSFLLTGEGIPLECTTTLSLRCRVRTSCSVQRQS